MNIIPLHTKPVRLLDGPLVELSRTELIRRMTATVLETGTSGDRDDAWLALRFEGFKVADIAMTIDDVLQAATQETVARIMEDK
jgi:hypothetical protein